MTLGELVAGAKALLLDFDGPVCSVFAGCPAPAVAAELRRHAFAHIDDIPPEIDSPHSLYIWCATRRPDLAASLDDVLTALEVEAIATAVPTPGAHEVIREAVDHGLPVAVVSNNAHAAIQRYANLHGVTEISLVVGRPYGNPPAMKPDPQMLITAAGAIGAVTSDCLFVGDAVTDMQAAQSAGAAGIGFAKSPRRRSGLESAGAAWTIDSLSELRSAIDEACK